jgi:hypothetical protein
MKVDRGNVGWGVGLVVLGVGWLLREVGLWPGFLRVWPLALLAAGMAMLVGARRRVEYALPLVLVAVGAVFALRDVGILTTGVVVPVVLIVIGVVLLVGSTRRPPEESTSLTIPRDGIERMHLEVHHGAGRLRVAAGSADGPLLDGHFAGGATHDVRRDGRSTEVEIHGASRRWERAIGWAPNNWSLNLHPDVPTTLELHTGATKTTMDLRDLRVPEAVVETGASDTEVVVPASGASRLRIEAGIANITVRVPDGVAAEIRNRSALGGAEIDEFRFPRRGDTHRSEGFETAQDRVTIELDGGLASFTVR